MPPKSLSNFLGASFFATLFFMLNILLKVDYNRKRSLEEEFF